MSPVYFAIAGVLTESCEECLDGV